VWTKADQRERLFDDFSYGRGIRAR